jgi:hypothetical protein
MVSPAVYGCALRCGAIVVVLARPDLDLVDGRSQLAFEPYRIASDLARDLLFARPILREDKRSGHLAGAFNEEVGHPGDLALMYPDVPQFGSSRHPFLPR